MIHKKIRIIAWLLCLCFCLMPCQALAASTSEASEPILPETECSLNVLYGHGETVCPGVEVKLYRIAEVSADFHYTLTPSFAASGLILDGIRTAGEWDVARMTLEAHILAHQIAPEVTAITKENGCAGFETLKTGMYLAIAGRAVQDEGEYLFDSTLIALPGLEPDGGWNYRASVEAKGELLPPVNLEEKAEWKVLKLWKGDEEQTNRPKSVEVEIFCDGSKYQTVTLSEENHWAYTWSAENDHSNWAVAERDVPTGYTATVEKRQSTFVVTNTWTPVSHPEGSGKPPQTGETSNILLYVLLLVGSGSGLILIGVIGKKSCV